MFPGFSVEETPSAHAGVMGPTPGWGGSPGEGCGSPLRYSCLENPMDRGACQPTVHGVTKSQTHLVSDKTKPNILVFMSCCCCNKLPQTQWHKMTHIYVIPVMEIRSMNGFPGLQSRISTGLGFLCWRRQWHPTLVLLPGKSHGQRSLVGCSPWVARSRT